MTAQKNSEASTTPAAVVSLVDRVVRLVEFLRPVATGAPVGPLEAFSALERSAVVSILGEAGSGKSTVLHFASAQLAADPGRLVLPPISPERFARGDTLFGWVLAALQASLLTSRPELLRETLGLDDHRRSMREEIDLLRRQEALSSANLRDSPAAGSATPDSVAVSLAAVTTAGLELVRGWWRLLDALVAAPSNHGIMQLVVPVDDADQNPDALADLLRDVRLLTAHPSVAVVLCANERVLVERMSRHEAAAGAAGENLARTTQAALVKALPRHLRAPVRGLLPEERLAFVPLGEDRTMRMLLAAIEMPSPKPVGIETLADYAVLHVGRVTTTSFYAEMLPSNPRRLQQLWYALDDLGAENVEGSAGHAVRILLEAAVADAEAQDARVPVDVVTLIEHSDGSVSLEVNLTDLRSGINSGRGVSIHQTAVRSVGVRRHNGFYLEGLASREGDQDAGTESVMTFPTSLTAAVHFTQEIGPPGHLPNPPVTYEGQRGRVARPGGSNWRATARVSVNRAEIPEAYLPVPDWDTFIDYAVYAVSWNRMMDGLEGVFGALGSTDDVQPITFAVWFHLMLVGQIQEGRAVEPDFLPDTADGWRSAIDAASEDDAWNRASTLLSDLYEGATTGIRDDDYKHWVDALLVATADPVFAPSELGHRVLRLRRAVLGDSADEKADGAASDLLAARVQRHLSAQWVPLTLGLLATLDSRRAEDLLSAHQLSLSERTREDQILADVLEERGVPATVIAQLTLEGMTEPVASALRAVGIAQQGIDQLRERFAPRRSNDARDPGHSRAENVAPPLDE